MTVRAWNVGMRSNEEAASAISVWESSWLEAVRGSRSVTFRALLRELKGDLAALGVADAALDLNPDREDLAEAVLPCLRRELTLERLEEWKNPWLRLEALERFAARLKGEPVPPPPDDLEACDRGVEALRLGGSFEAYHPGTDRPRLSARIEKLLRE